MRKIHLMTGTALVCTLGWSIPTLAAEETSAPVKAIVEKQLPGQVTVAEDFIKIRRQNDITFVSGGVSDQEQKVMQSLSGKFNLKLTFATEKQGKYLSDVRVHILDAQNNTLLDTLSAGPIFLADLDPGTYTVEASGFGQDYRETAKITDQKQAHLMFRWPESASLMEAEPKQLTPPK